MNNFETEERGTKYPLELLQAWASKTGCAFNDERVQFPDECGWPADFKTFLAGWNANDDHNRKMLQRIYDNARGYGSSLESIQRWEIAHVDYQALEDFLYPADAEV